MLRRGQQETEPKQVEAVLVQDQRIAAVHPLEHAVASGSRDPLRLQQATESLDVRLNRVDRRRWRGLPPEKRGDLTRADPPARVR